MLILLLLISLSLSRVNLSEFGYYEVLGVARHATSQQIRQAYKKLAVKLHPDKNPDPLEQEKFIKLSEAYETLKDPGKRQQYDLYGSFATYTHRQDSRSRASYDHMFYNGLYANDQFVENLTPNNFENYLSNGVHFINFYSPFCPPCQSLSEDWKTLAEEYHGIVGVAAVNCKYYNAFCYNRMRIHSYPTLQLYLDGTSVQYGREREAEALRTFLTAQLWRAAGQGPEPRCRLRVTTLGAHADARLAYLLMGVATVTVMAEEEEEEEARCAGRLRCGAGQERCVHADEAGERGMLRAVASALPPLATIHHVELTRSPGEWAVLLRRRVAPDLELMMRRLRATLTDLHYGVVDCSTSEEVVAGVCGTLGAGEAAGWGVRKVGGAWQRVSGVELPELARAVRRALRARSLHSLYRPPPAPSAPLWVVGAEGARTQLEDAAAQLAHRTDLQFGLVRCEGEGAGQWAGQWDRGAVCAEGAVEVRLGARRYRYRGEDTLSQYILTHLDSAVHAVPATQAQAWGGGGEGQHARLVAYMPARCHSCDTLSYQWARVADKLRALPHIWVGEVRCGEGQGQGLCSNVHAPAARLYLAHDSAYHTTSLQSLGEAAYMLQWALSLLPPAPRPLQADTFHETQNRRRPWLVYFHSPRCRHCYEMFADFAIAAASVSESASVGKVDCVSERGLCAREGVRAYPELRVYAGGRVSSVRLRDHRLLLQDLRALLPATSHHDEL